MLIILIILIIQQNLIMKCILINLNLEILLSTKTWRILRQSCEKNVYKKGKLVIDKNFMKDTKKYMRIINYFREFSDLYFEDILELGINENVKTQGDTLTRDTTVR